MKLLRETVEAYLMHNGAMLSAALAFYSLLAFAPFGVFLVAFVGVVYGEKTARDELVLRLADTVGPAISADIAGVLERASAHGSTAMATFVGAVLFVMATSRVFLTVSEGLNHVWGVTPIISASLRGAGLQVLQRRLVALAMVFFCGLVFISFVGFRTGFDIAAATWLDLPFVFRLIELVLGWAAITVVTTVVYRVLPDAWIAWEDARVGGAVTGALAVVGAALAGQYVARLAVSSPYGAAGSLFALLLWVYYCSQIFFFGAEFTATWARHRGHGVKPLAYARYETFGDRPTDLPVAES